VLYSVVRTRILGVIPARFASSRFPGKSLARLADKTILQHVYERAAMARSLNSGVLIATDDPRIAAEARRFGGRVRMTREDHPSGTDRLAEVASAEVAEVYVNIQGDEPLIDPGAVDAAVLGTLGAEGISMGTLSHLIEDPSEVNNPNVVKVVTNLNGEAIYFSRYPIPFERDPGPSVGDLRTPLPNARGSDGEGASTGRYKHIGLYVYRRDLLLRYPDLPIGPLEKAECLEQLRALENGYRIKVIPTEYESFGVDTPEDLARLQHLFDVAEREVRIST
jgi:3-deoxy-manno-octulosonate cytidylyltransferase (CMP-KDO synthetase)